MGEPVATPTPDPNDPPAPDWPALIGAAFAGLNGGAKPPIPVTSVAEPLAPLSNEYVESIGGAGKLPLDMGLSYMTELLDPSNVRSQQAVIAARRRYAFGGLTQDDVQVLVASGDLTVEQARKLAQGTDGGDGNALGWAELQRQQGRDKMADTINYLNTLLSGQSVEDTRSQARQQALAEAIPYGLAPGTEYYPGFAPDDPGVKAGIVSAQRAHGYAFDPNSVGADNPYDAQIAAAVEKFRALAGV